MRGIWPPDAIRMLGGGGGAETQRLHVVFARRENIKMQKLGLA